MSSFTDYFYTVGKRSSVEGYEKSGLGAPKAGTGTISDGFFKMDTSKDSLLQATHN